MQENTIEVWLSRLRLRVNESAPDLIDIFDTYASEARFGRTYIQFNLKNLKRGANLLEVGAGALILSTQLVREGFNVTALEPSGHGFTHLDLLRELIMSEAVINGCQPNLIEIPAELLEVKGKYDFAFSINVMEHVQSVETVIKKVCESLNSNGEYRFTCPNYLFPYEPHFNIPTLISRNLTERIFRSRIVECSLLADPIGVWNSLNWISVRMVRKISRSLNISQVHFDKTMLSTMMLRASRDQEFSARRSPLLVAILSVMVKFRLHKLAFLIPAVAHPVIDCTLSNKS